MNKIYKRNGSNPMSGSEQNTTNFQIERMKNKNHKQKRNEKFMLVVIFLIGIFGFRHVYFLEENISSESKLALVESLENTATKLPTKSKKKLDKENQLSIEGNFEANEKMQFILDSYNNEVIYTLRYGNGYGELLKGKVTEYTYTSSGVFQVTLEARFKDEKVIMHNEYLSIDDAILVADGAFEEQI